MSKKKPHKKQKETPKTESKTSLKNTDEPKEYGKVTLLILTFLLAIVYFIFSTFSDGFYMHDEVGNFMTAQSIWYDNLLQIIGANTKSGYRLLYAIPALGGFTFLKFFNSLVAAFTVYVSYQVLNKIGSKNKLLIFFILGLQPLWFMLAFRNYTEMTVAFLLVLGTFQFFNKKYIFSALIISYVAFTRQEYHLILALLFFILLLKKEWIAALLTGTFTVLQNLLGYIITGDILYLPHSMAEYSEKIKDAWPKQGFDHYFIMSNVIFGAIALTLFIAYIAIIIIKKKQPNWYLLIPILFIFLLNCAFNAQSFTIGPGNGGNLRYLIIISPLIAILGVKAIDEIIDFNKKYLLLVFLIPLILLVGIYQTYEDNFVHLTDVENWKPLLFTILISVLLLLPLKPKHYLISIGFLTVILGFSSITTRKIQPEERAVKKASNWYTQQLKLKQNQLFSDTNRVVCGHTLFYYYLGKNKHDFVKEPIMGLGITKETADTLKKGDLIIWDTHYGYRPKLQPTSQQYDFFQNNPNFRRIQYYQSSDNRFTIVFFQKVKD